MKTNVFLATILVLALVSCDNTRTKEISKALTIQSPSYDYSSKRGYDDLVENLYKELVSQNMDLKKLEDKIDELQKSKEDTLNLFNQFTQKNQSYFNSVNDHISGIQDSLLRDKTKALIANNLAKYNTSVARHNELLQLIQAKNLTINDLHKILKIVKTLPLMEQYQSDNLPDVKSLEGYIKQQDGVIKYADTLLQK
jgi:DNA anti-recombination protein RmuC